jgi:uncharacterized membrane protein HdeD (DUF308 family)
LQAFFTHHFKAQASLILIFKINVVRTPTTSDENLEENTMAKSLWLSLLLRGIIAVLFGVCVFYSPFQTVKILVMVFGAFAAIDGFALIAASLSWKEHHEDWGLLLVAGIGIAGLGIISFLRPGITELLLLALIAARFMISGLTEIIMAVRLRKQIEGEWMLMVDGALSFMIGLVLIAWPATGALTMIWLFGSISMLAGVIMIIIALRFRGDIKMLQEEVKSVPQGSEQPS